MGWRSALKESVIDKRTHTVCAINYYVSFTLFKIITHNSTGGGAELLHTVYTF